MRNFSKGSKVNATSSQCTYDFYKTCVQPTLTRCNEVIHCKRQRKHMKSRNKDHREKKIYIIQQKKKKKTYKPIPS